MFFPDIYIEPPPEYAERVENPVWFYDDPESPFFSTPSGENYGLNPSPIGFEIEAVSISGCHICITFNYTVGFVRFPSSTICYIKPECQQQPPDNSGFNCVSEENIEAFNEWVLSNFSRTNLPRNEDFPPRCPPPENPNLENNRPNETINIRQFGQWKETGYNYVFDRNPQERRYSNVGNVGRINSYSGPNDLMIEEIVPARWVGLGTFRNQGNGNASVGTTLASGSNGGAIYRSRSTGQRFVQFYSHNGYTQFVSWAGDIVSENRYGTSNQNYWVEINGIPYENNLPLLPPRPPQPPNEDSPMDCCEEILRRLRQIQDDLVILMRWTGAKPGVMQVPKTFMNKQNLNENFIEGLINLFENDEITIQSLPELMKWMVERQQEWMGEYPLKMEDSQGNKLAAPNIAVANQTILSKLIAEGELNQLSNAALSKILLEVALTRQSNALVSSQLETIISFLNISINERTLEMKHGFTLPNDEQIALESVDTVQEFEQFLQNSTRNIKIVDLANSNNDLADLRFKVDKILALLNRNTITADDTRQSIINKLRDNSEDNEMTDLPTDWIDQLERQSGEITPWGDTVDERPQLDARQ